MSYKEGGRRNGAVSVRAYGAVPRVRSLPRPSRQRFVASPRRSSSYTCSQALGWE